MIRIVFDLQPVIMDLNERSKVFLRKPKRDVSRMQFIHLTPREHEILNHISYGHTTEEIAILLRLSKHTVITYRKILFRKMNAYNPPLLVRRGFELGFLKNTEVEIVAQNSIPMPDMA